MDSIFEKKAYIPTFNSQENFHECQIVKWEPLNSKKGHKRKPVWAMRRQWKPRMQFINGGESVKLLISQPLLFLDC